MQIFIFLIFSLFFSFTCFGQIEVPERYIDPSKTLDFAGVYLKRLNDSLIAENGFLKRKYPPCKTDTPIILDRSLDTLFKPVFSTVILNSDNIINNGTSGSVSFDGEKSTISLNFMHQLKERPKKNSRVLNIGISANSKNSNFNFYSGGSWNKDFDLSLGYTWIPYNSKFNYSSPYRVEIERKRKLFLSKKISSYYKIYSVDTSLINADLYRFKRITIDRFNASDTTSVKLLRDSADYAILMIPKLDSLLKAKKKLDKIFNNPNEKYDSIYYNDIVEWEKNNVIIDKYKMKWHNMRFTIGQKTLSLYDSTLTRLFAIDSFNRNYLRFKFEYNFNYTAKRENSLKFSNIGIAFSNTNILENNSPDKLPFIKKDPFGVYTIFNDPKEPVISSDQFRQNIYILTPSCYYAILFGKKKQTLGLEMQTSVNFSLNKLKNSTVQYKDNFSTTIGLLLRTNNAENVSTATASIYGGFQNADLKLATFKEDFVFGIRVGVPFMDLIKKK